MRQRELFLLLVHLSWRIKAEIQEHPVVWWERKPTTEHPYKWQVRICVFWTAGAEKWSWGPCGMEAPLQCGSWEHCTCCLV